MMEHARRTVACVAFASVTLALAQSPAHVAPGPYKAGYVQVVETRAAPPAGAERPVVMSIFYPVDPAGVTDATPRPDYWVHPGHPTIGNRVFPSSAFDAFGFEPAYSGLPVAPGKPFPVLVLSPGGNAPWLTGQILGPNVATYGYVVVLIGHLEVGVHEAVALKLRDGDVRFVLDRLLARNATAGDLLEGAIDPEKIAGAGWSFGGYVVTALAGGDDEPCVWLAPNAPAWACEPTEPDPRVKALVLLDPSTWVSDPWDLNRVHVPVISINQSYDSLRSNGSTSGADFAYHHALFTGSPNYRVDVDGSNHHRFGSACEYWRLLPQFGYVTARQAAAALAARQCDRPDRLHTWQVMYPLIAEYAIAFLETHLAGRPGLEPLLTPGHAQTRERFIHFLTTEPMSPIMPLEHVHEFWFFPYQPGATVERADVAALRPGATLLPPDDE